MQQMLIAELFSWKLLKKTKAYLKYINISILEGNTKHKKKERRKTENAEISIKTMKRVENAEIKKMLKIMKKWSSEMLWKHREMLAKSQT